MNRGKLSLHSSMQFWIRHFGVLLLWSLVVDVANRLLLGWQFQGLLLQGLVLSGCNYFVSWFTFCYFFCEESNCYPYSFRYSNIFVTAPSPENLKTLFEFVCKGFNVLEYKVCLLILSKLAPDDYMLLDMFICYLQIVISSRLSIFFSFLLFFFISFVRVLVDVLQLSVDWCQSQIPLQRDCSLVLCWNLCWWSKYV